jgi:hypothetical protein
MSYEAAEDTPGVWRELYALNADERIIRATLRRDGDELEVTANSEARLDRVLTRLTDVADVVAHSAHSVRNPADLEAALKLHPPEEPSESIDPEIVEQVLDMMERRWIGEEVPALGGITPRQAAVDPTRREDLIALLRSFDRMPTSGSITMRPNILRRHLGLEE